MNKINLFSRSLFKIKAKSKISHVEFLNEFELGNKYWKCPICDKKVHNSFVNRHTLKDHGISREELYKKIVECEPSCRVCGDDVVFSNLYTGFDFGNCKKKCIYIDRRLINPRKHKGNDSFIDLDLFFKEDDEYENQFKYSINYSKTLPSVNEMYRLGRSRYRSWLFLDPSVADFKELVSHTLSNAGIYGIFKRLDKPLMCKLEVVFCFKNNFWGRDTSNLIKAFEDAIVNCIGVDDAFNVEVNLKKILNDLDDMEHIFVSMSTKKLDEDLIKLSSFIGIE